eukprot:m.222630 g.222630  ORF g.222630 m.222630 type:complete len:371 (-) comp15938_c0_seq1:1060-2172(-)
MTSTLKVAILGCGMISEHHVKEAKKRNAKINVTATIDLSKENRDKLATITGGTPFESLEAALQSDVEFDAVAVLLPHDLHEKFSKEVFAAKKHLFLEKPIGRNIEECKRIFEAADEAKKNYGCVFYAAENASFWPEIVRAKELIQDGYIGELITARAHYYECLSDSPMSQDPNNWRNSVKRCGGGSLIDGGQHWLRPLREFMGEVDKVMAVTDRPWSTLEGESLVHGLIKFQSGKTASIQVTTLGSDSVLGNEEPWFRVIGTRGEIVITGSFEGGGTVLSVQNGKELLLPEGTPQGFLRSYGYQMANFADAVLENKPLHRVPSCAMGELLIALACYRSSVSNNWEDVWETGTERWQGQFPLDTLPKEVKR